MSIGAAYLAPEGLETVMEQDLARRGVGIALWHGRLALAEAAPVACPWALDIWTAPQELPAPSVKAAADALRAIQRNWAAYPVEHFRRMALIGERLPPVAARPLAFPQPAPTAPLGAWTLLAPDRMLASSAKSSAFVNGEVAFVEDRIGPPSRAYLKLWEACTRLGRWPGPGERCFDLGACPGGWTWAIATLGAAVVAVDKAPLEPRVAALPGVTLRQESAFGLAPEDADWMFSDIIAYPRRLLDLVTSWIESGRVKSIVCTLKFQGETDFETADTFASIPGGLVMHLSHNKHELTFAWTRG